MTSEDISFPLPLSPVVRSWMKLYVVYALVWSLGIIQTDFLFLSSRIDKPDVIHQTAVPILISLAGIVSPSFWTVALAKILSNRNLECGFILFIFLMCVYQIATIVFSAVKKLFRDFSGEIRKISDEAVKVFNLTLRETDIANLLLIGMNSREIGEKLFITKKTRLLLLAA